MSGSEAEKDEKTKVAVRYPRVGQGVDVHPFKEGRDLVLGGVRIPQNVEKNVVAVGGVVRKVVEPVDVGHLEGVGPHSQKGMVAIDPHRPLPGGVPAGERAVLRGADHGGHLPAEMGGEREESPGERHRGSDSGQGLPFPGDGQKDDRGQWHRNKEGAAVAQDQKSAGHDEKGEDDLPGQASVPAQDPGSKKEKKGHLH